MPIRPLSLIVGAVVCALLAACGGGGSSDVAADDVSGSGGSGSSGASGASISATAAATTEDAHLSVAPRRATFAFVAQSGLDSVAVYSLDPATSALYLVGTAPTGVGSRPAAAIVDPAKRFLYVANSGSAKIARFAIDPLTGALTAAGDTATFDMPLKLAVDPLGRFLYVGHGGTTPRMSSYAIAADGSLNQAAVERIDDEPLGLAVNRTGRYLFATVRAGKYHQITIDPGTGAFVWWNSTTALLGALTRNPVSDGIYAASMANSQLYYSPDGPDGDYGNDTLLVTTGTPSPLRALAADPEGRFLYATRVDHATWPATSRVESYAIDPVTGEVAGAGTLKLAGGCTPDLLSVDPLGRALQAACGDGSGRVFTIAIDRTSGVLTQSGSITLSAGAAPKSIEIVNLNARFVYVTDAAGSGISIRSVDTATGALPEAAPPLAVPATPAAVTVDRSGRHLYVVSATDNSVRAFTIDAATGVLSSLGTPLGTGSGPTALVLEPSGRFAYVPNSAESSISRYTVDSMSGALGGRTDLPSDGAGPNGIAFHGSGRYAYVTSAGGGQHVVKMYAADRVTGDLTILSAGGAGASLGGVPQAIAVDATGRFVYVAAGDAVASLTVNVATGWLFPTSQTVADAHRGLALGGAVRALALDPTGRYVYAATAGSNRLAALAIGRAPSSSDPGALTAFASVAMSGAASSLLVDPSGRALYGALDSSAPALSSFFIDRSTPQPQLGTELPTPIAMGAGGIALSP